MLEASGENQNGGIFSLPVDFSLHTCPPKGKVPALLKKFGKWDEDTENFLKYPIHYASKNGIFLTASSDVSCFHTLHNISEEVRFLSTRHMVLYIPSFEVEAVIRNVVLLYLNRIPQIQKERSSQLEQVRI